jgi:RHS repeat-associated protein
MMKAEQRQMVWMELYLAVVECCEEDHLGSNRVVASTTGEAEQVNHYYPYGSTFYGETSTDHRFKYCGKELDRMHGLDWYDSSARFYDHVLGRFHQMDPLAEKYYACQFI